ncbi:restriction endonuclease subunit S [Staphylococcus hominis]
MQPTLRFPEFKDEWEVNKLGLYTNVIMGQSPSSKNYTNDSNNIVLVQGNADLQKGKIYPRIYTTEITKTAEKHDIILTVRAPVGELAISQMKACIGRGVCAIKGNTFIYTYLNYLNDKNYWKRIVQGSTFESISGTDVKNVPLKIPSKKEQEKIGRFFSKIDQQIELEEKKLELLEQQKKGYMQKIFSQELRFKDENGNDYPNWNKTLIKDIFEFENNRRKPITSSLREKGIYPYYGATGIIDYVKNYLFDNEERLLIGEDGAKWGQFESSSFIANGKYWVNNHAHVVKSNTDNLYFMNYYLNFKELRTFVTGNAPAKLTHANLCSINIKMPTRSEQDKISYLLKGIESKVNKQLKKIGLLKQRKQGLLQKMFV